MAARKTTSKKKAKTRAKKTGGKKKTTGKSAAPKTAPPPLAADASAEEIECRCKQCNLRSRKLQRYAALLLSGTKREKALVEAGYAPKNRRNARSMARRLERYLIDKGVLREALAHSGINQLTMADALREVFEEGEPREKLKAVTLIGRWLGYEQKQEEESDPTAAELDFETADQLEALVASELERRRANGT